MHDYVNMYLIWMMSMICLINMFSIMISRITCTHNLTVELMIRVYALINHMNIHENLNIL